MQNGYQTLETPQSNRNTSGSVTPTPRSKYGQLSHGSSQSSLNSTNPFDDDMDDDDNVSRVTTVDGVTVRKPARKKRRAPPPPTTQRASTPLSGNVSILGILIIILLPPLSPPLFIHIIHQYNNVITSSDVYNII